jgi:CheY-like chemotaxis protein
MKSFENAGNTAVIAFDDPESSEMIGEMIRLIGLVPKPVFGVNKTIETIAQEKPDLILIDLDMQKNQAMQLIEKIHADAQLSRIPLLTISGTTTENSNPESEMEPEILCPDLIQPFGFQDFRTAVAGILEI